MAEEKLREKIFEIEKEKLFMPSKKSSLIITMIIALFVITILPVLANGTHNGEHEEDTSIGHQFEEILPFHHLSEGHAFAGIVLILLWISFFYMLYTLFQTLNKKKK